jgi:urease accessory protein
VLGLQLVNPTAGLFAGDQLTLYVDIADRAQVALTSPSATRYHTMPSGRADVIQQFRIGEGAWLDYWPEMVIPQRDSDVRQTIKIQLAPTASMVFLDLLAPGRVAHGERYAFRKFETRLEICQNNTLLARERCVLEPTKNIWPLKVPGWDLCYYGALWIAGEQAAQSIKHLNLANTVAHVGASLVDQNLAVIRVVAPSSLVLRKVTQQLRALLKHDLPLLATDFRKL